MDIKKVFIFFSFLSFLFFIAACSNATAPAATEPDYPVTDRPDISKSTSPPATTVSDYPVTGRLDISRVTFPGRETELSFNINIIREWKGSWQIVRGTSGALANSKAWITVWWAGIDGSYSEARKYTDIPIKDIVVSGDTSWEGNALNNRTVQLKSTIRLPKDGKWVFIARFTGDNWSQPLTFDEYMVVADGTAVRDYSDDLKSSPIAYLAYFDYGQITALPANAQRPFSLELDMARPPLAGEEVKITFRAFSPFYDIKDFKIEIQFWKRPENGGDLIGVPDTNIMVSSELAREASTYIIKFWKIDLQKDETRELVNVIKFPESGEWQLSINGHCVIPNLGYASTGDRIQLTITGNKSYYGWKPQY